MLGLTSHTTDATEADIVSMLARGVGVDDICKKHKISPERVPVVCSAWMRHRIRQLATPETLAEYHQQILCVMENILINYYPHAMGGSHKASGLVMAAARTIAQLQLEFRKVQENARLDLPQDGKPLDGEGVDPWEREQAYLDGIPPEQETITQRTARRAEELLGRRG